MRRLIAALVLSALAVAALGCTPAPEEKEEAGTIEIVGAVPPELLHWFGNEMGQDRGARVFSNSHGEYTYYVATAGRQSVKGGEIKILEKDAESDHWSVKLEYMYPELTERSLDAHFLIFRVPLEQPTGVSIVAATGAAD